MRKKYNIAVVGVGAVGLQMLRCLRIRRFPIKELRVFARSGRDINIDGLNYKVEPISAGGFDGIDIALFAGTEGEKGAAVTFAHEAIRRGAVVIDNGADFRMNKKVPLVIPEVNPRDIRKHKGIIANPNCSTIQMVVAIWPIYKKFGIKRIIVCSYQAVSGAGRGGIVQLEDELKQRSSSQRTFTYNIAKNVIPQIGRFEESGFTTEEWKMVRETHKIMHDKKIKISATCVRVPVVTGHCEAVYLETRKRATAQSVRELLNVSPGVVVIDRPQDQMYPLPIESEGKEPVFVGRIRNDPFLTNALWLWIVSDNLLKGAALNAIQIAEKLISSESKA